MTKNITRKIPYRPKPATFGGYVYDFDFNCYQSLSELASRIISDGKFDKQCKTNTQTIQNYKKKGRNK